MSRRAGTLTLRREDGRIVCDSVSVADGTFRRLRGLLGRKSLRADEGIVLRPAWSIHTAFMRFSIDVVFIDAEQVVMRVEPDLRPFHTASCRGAREVVELAAGECARRGLAPGDRVAWASRDVVNALPATKGPALEGERLGTVLIASADARFVKLARFLLEGRGITIEGQTVPVSLPDALVGANVDANVDAVLLDAGASLGDGLRALNNARAQRPDVPFVLVAEAPGDRAPASVRVYDKWQETEAAMSALQQAITGIPSETEGD
jgi:uncharacterized membrane protein (UPF0127 family)/CheY-like chemotaxis protein